MDKPYIVAAALCKMQRIILPERVWIDPVPKNNTSIDNGADFQATPV